MLTSVLDFLAKEGYTHVIGIEKCDPLLLVDANTLFYPFLGSGHASKTLRDLTSHSYSFLRCSFFFQLECKPHLHFKDIA